MKQLFYPALTMAIVGLATASMPAGDPLSAGKPELDPQEVFQSALGRLKDLEARHAALKGVSEVKPRLELDGNKRLKAAYYAFERNAVPPGKSPARAKDEDKPFVFVAVTVWSGGSQQPPAGLRGFRWKGEDYTAWVQVHGSDAQVVKAVRKAVDEPILAPIPRK